MQRLFNRQLPKIFISYSEADFPDIEETICTIQVGLRERYEIIYWREDKAPGEEDWPHIFRMIEESNIVIPFIVTSEDGTRVNAIERSLAVGIEIGYAKALKKRIIPIVHPSVERKRLAAMGQLSQPLLIYITRLLCSMNCVQL